MTKRLGILHAYPGRYLLDTLYRDNYRVVLIGGGAAFYDHPAVEKVIEIDLGNHEGVKAALQSYHADAPFDALCQFTKAAYHSRLRSAKCWACQA